MLTKKCVVVTKFLSVVLAGTFALPTALAHESGHGSKTTELGPKGGKLFPVVNAKEAELGEKAKTVGYAEFKIDKNVLSVYVLTADRKPIATIYGGNVKWIIFPVKGKHRTITTKIQNELDLKLELKNLPKLKAVEVIVPTFSEFREPHVTYLKLN